MVIVFIGLNIAKINNKSRPNKLIEYEVLQVLFTA